MIFEKATRDKVRWDSPVGLLSVEQLWDLPLTSANANRPNLDAMARTVNTELKSLEEGSFVTLKPDPRKAGLELQLEVLKRVIAVKLEEREKATKAAANAERKRKLLAALGTKEEAALAGMSKEDIEKEIAALDA